MLMRLSFYFTVTYLKFYHGLARRKQYCVFWNLGAQCRSSVHVLRIKVRCYLIMKKYALIDWIHSNSCSIILSRGIADERMLTDNTLIGKVKDILEGQKEPANGWPQYDGRVIAVSGQCFNYNALAGPNVKMDAPSICARTSENGIDVKNAECGKSVKHLTGESGVENR